MKAVLGADAEDIVDAVARAEAVKLFLYMPEFQAIGAACKRTRNILNRRQRRELPRVEIRTSCTVSARGEESGCVC